LKVMPECPARYAFAAVLLAAGASSRMGRPKLLLPWGATSILGHHIHEWTQLGAAQTAVVLAAGNQPLNAELDRLGFAPADRIINPHPERGMFSSIQCAAQWTGWNQTLSHWAIVLGDQPHLRVETLRALIQFASANPGKICQPSFHGRARHPVFLPKAAVGELRQSTAKDLKQFLHQAPCERAWCELEDRGLDLDIDRPEDYARALNEFG